MSASAASGFRGLETFPRVLNKHSICKRTNFTSSVEPPGQRGEWRNKSYEYENCLQNDLVCVDSRTFELHEHCDSETSDEGESDDDRNFTQSAPPLSRCPPRLAPLCHVKSPPWHIAGLRLCVSYDVGFGWPRRLVTLSAWVFVFASHFGGVPGDGSFGPFRRLSVHGRLCFFFDGNA